MRYPIAARVNAVDTDSDGFADRLYAADLGGQVWRFDIWNGKPAIDARHRRRAGKPGQRQSVPFHSIGGAVSTSHWSGCAPLLCCSRRGADLAPGFRVLLQPRDRLGRCARLSRCHPRPLLFAPRPQPVHRALATGIRRRHSFVDADLFDITSRRMTFTCRQMRQAGNSTCRARQLPGPARECWLSR